MNRTRNPGKYDKNVLEQILYISLRDFDFWSLFHYVNVVMT